MQYLRVPKFDMNVAKKLPLVKIIKEFFLYFKKILFFLRNLLMDAHKAACRAPRGVAVESRQSASGRGEEVLLMVEMPQCSGSDETVLRTIDELQPGGSVKHSIPYRDDCAYTLLQGEPAKSCLCSYLLLLSMLNPSLGGQLL